MNMKHIAARLTRSKVRPLLRYALLLFTTGFAAFTVQAENVPPSPQNTTVEVGFDRRGIPAKIDVWRNVSGGYNPDGCPDSNCNGSFAVNTLVCHSSDNPANGACPTAPLWRVDAANLHALTLDFTHSSGHKETLRLNTSKWSGEAGVVWAAAMISRYWSSGFNVSIPASSLNQLTQVGRWTAQLRMQVMTWQDCAGRDTTGCPGTPLVTWDATITLNVSDTGTQQIYFPAFKHTSPRIDLNVNNRPGTGNNTLAGGSNSLDMCLYDGSNSTSNRISLLFQDEGAAAPDRAAGRFSVYRDGADKTQASNRIDYQVSVINPTTGSRQTVSNGTEITWTNTNNRNIQREVVIPGLPGPLFCVPAPLTLTTPQFTLADKSAGHYTGTLRIIYTPTTQTG